MKNRKLLISFIITLISFCIFIFTASFLINNYKEVGSFQYNKEYYDVVLSNTRIDFKTTMSVKVDNETDTIHVKIPNLNEFNKKREFTIDMTNIGSLDAELTDYHINEILSNVEEKSTDINLSIKKSEIIESTDSKVLIISIKYNGQKKDNAYYEFDIKYKFNEVIL